MTLSGIVIKRQSGFFTVQTELEGAFICKVPKRIKYQQSKRQQTANELTSDLVAAGDRVLFRPISATEGQIEFVEPRHSVLSRARPAAQARQQALDWEQVLVANPDQIVIVLSWAQPEPSLRKLDRFLVVAEMNQLPALICINKIDLVEEKSADALTKLFEPYQRMGYPLFFTSTITNEGVAELRQALQGKLSVLTGSSGVGKSSLLNAIQPGLGVAIGEVSQATTKGMHTTRHTQLFALDGGGYLADTPGVRGVAVFDLLPTELDGYFREIAPYVAACAFSNCSHRHEPACAVRQAVLEGAISAERYDSYLRLREEHEALQKSAYKN